MPAPPPANIGPWILGPEIGRGAFGVVFRAHHKDDPETPVALKLIPVRGNLDRLKLEPAMVSRLEHPCIVRVLDYFVHEEDQFAIVMEYIPGRDLKAAIDETDRFSPNRVREVLLQIGGALVEAHAHGVVHRDLKPANVLVQQLEGKTRYVLTDFGVGAEDVGIRSEKKVAGTFLFMSPEQIRGRAGPQSDLWALGVTAYRMLTGQYPFPGPTLAELSKQIQLTTPAPPSQLSGERIDPQLERVVMRLLDRSQTERIASAADLLRELGHSGDAKTVLSGVKVAPAKTRGRVREESLDQSLARQSRAAYTRMGVWIAAYLMVTGPVGGVLVLLALFVFFRAFSRHRGLGRYLRVTMALVLIGLRILVDPAVNELLGYNPAELIKSAIVGAIGQVSPFAALTAILAVGVVVVFYVGIFAFPILAAGRYAEANRLRRERLLLRAGGEAGSAEEYLRVLAAEVPYRYEDVGFHLRYAEALAAAGRLTECAVEARLLLEQDPYHFTGNLLLANMYFQLGLKSDCLKVCREYLKVSGYCFEFDELAEECRTREAVQA